VLRISLIVDSGQAVQLALEGWLVGPWVDELRQQSELVLSQEKILTLDLGKVLFVDPRGAALLRELAERHVAHVECSPFIARQLKETSL
jgi:ABC-type transporter Mla MlaB component